MRRRSNLLVLLGLASFVLGLLAVYLITGDDDDGGGGDSNSVEVIIAREDLEAATLGNDILNDNRYDTKRIPRAELTPDMVTTAGQLTGTKLTARIEEGDTFRTTTLVNIGGTQAAIPEGFQAVSVTVGFVAGGANSIAPGDTVNVFLVIPAKLEFTEVDATGTEKPAAPPYGSPRAELLLTNTRVLDVQTGTAPFQVGSPPASGTSGGAADTGSSLIIVLAVDTFDAEKVIFGTAVDGAELYLSRVPLEEDGTLPPPAPVTPGIDFLTVLREEANTAFERTNPEG